LFQSNEQCPLVNEPKSLTEIRKALRALFKAIRHCEDPESRKRLQRVFTTLNKIGGDMLPDDKTIPLNE
jgi:hypothetical protein